MANAVRVRLDGDKELMAKLKRLGADSQAVLEAATTAGLALVQDDARPLAPGPEIEMETESRSATRVAVLCGPTKEKWYYQFFETGTAAGVRTARKGGMFTFMGSNGRLIRVKSINHPGMAAKPFMRPAWDKNKGREGTMVSRMKKAFKQEIDNASR